MIKLNRHNIIGGKKMKKLDKTNVYLKEFQESDLEEFYRIAKNKEVKQFVKLFYPNTFEDTKKILELAKKDYIVFKIVDERDSITGAIAGRKTENKIIDVSYFIGPRYRGKGYCSKAVKLFKAYLKKTSNYKVMRFLIASNNYSSQHVMNRVGISYKYTRMYRVYECKI